MANFEVVRLAGPLAVRELCVKPVHMRASKWFSRIQDLGNDGTIRAYLAVRKRTVPFRLPQSRYQVTTEGYVRSGNPGA